MNRRDQIYFNREMAMLNRLISDDPPPLYKSAQDSSPTLGQIPEGIKSYVAKMYDPNNKVESILALLAPGLMWGLGLRWIPILYELAQALGFNWTHFFTSIKDHLRPHVVDMLDHKTVNFAEIKDSVTQGAEQSLGSDIDAGKLISTVEKYASINNLLLIKKLAIRVTADRSLKETVLHWVKDLPFGGKLIKSIVSFIVRVVIGFISAAFVSVAFLLAGGVASTLLGTNKPGTDHSSPSTAPSADTSKVTLQLNPSASPNLSTTTINDNEHVWMLHFNISEIKDHLIEWAKELFPQLNDPSAFDASPEFKKTLSLFEERNNKTGRLQLTAVPQLFTSVKDIVLSFAADVALHTKGPSDATNL